MNKTQQKLNDYEGFVEKFKPKKTTDDCYTPPLVYDAVLRWVKVRYQIDDATRVIRPFYPGGDYQNEDYSGDCIVVDNPPFSMLAKILRWYQEQGVRFFLFAPHLTLFSPMGIDGLTAILTDATIIYDNGANVKTSFINNLSPEYVIEVAGTLRKALDDAIEQGKTPNTLPKYEYPPEVLLSSSKALCDMAKAGFTWQIKRSEAFRVMAIDAQRAKGKALFGSGYLISERLAQERLVQERLAQERLAQECNPATIWELSDRERAIIKSLAY